ncbi:hypothetical protein HKX48_009148 [Thoreauomyces humboldtii]|nr:hypothetical protein HKX48_009148 [Thoreauomyces humboldtii]
MSNSDLSGTEPLRKRKGGKKSAAASAVATVAAISQDVGTEVAGKLSEAREWVEEKTWETSAKIPVPAAPEESSAFGTSSTIIGLLTIVALGIRLFRIQNPAQVGLRHNLLDLAIVQLMYAPIYQVVFDEVHFGGFAAKYINQTFFMDVHPPLGKMMIAGSGLFAGFDGVFDFKEIGKDYLATHVPYVAMRLLPAILGVLIVPIAYMTMRNLQTSNATAIMTAVLVAFENALACQSRLILLDSILVFFTALSIQMWTAFQAVKHQSFSAKWWIALVASGAAIGLAASVKWVGLFVIAWVGISTLNYIWDLLGDPRVTPARFFKHFLALAGCLIVVPVAVYMATFYIHFRVLHKAGTGTGHMSPEFQSTLDGNELTETFAEIGFGSNVMIRHENTNGGYIHSHKHYYPTGSKQQQVTLYPYGDTNSILTILPPLIFDNGTAENPEITNFTRVKHGDIIRLEHVHTQMRIHSHDHRAPVTDTKVHAEVSGYGAPGFLGDTNDHWRVEILNLDPKHPELRALDHKFRLIHQNTGCALFSHKVKLPEWGFGQQEVTCATNGKKELSSWRIDFNDHMMQPEDSQKIHYTPPTFLGKFLESHRVMWRINSGLDGAHPYQSRPQQWPLLGRTISFWSSKTGPEKLHLVGNPLVWFLAAGSVGLFLALFAIGAILDKRRVTAVSATVARTTQHAGLMFLGWLLHYVPFFAMTRQLFLHHYLPSLYFSVLLFGSLFDGLTRRLLLSTSTAGTRSRKVAPYAQWILATCVTVAAVYVYLRFSPLTYGLPMEKDYCNSLKWRKVWDWECKGITKK